MTYNHLTHGPAPMFNVLAAEPKYTLGTPYPDYWVHDRINTNPVVLMHPLGVNTDAM